MNGILQVADVPSQRQLALRVLDAGLLTQELVEETPWTIGERYEVLETLGRGGAGVVFRVRDAEDGREYAIKLLDLAASPNPERFLREARLLEEVRDPGVVRVHGSGLHGGAPYYVMDLASEGTLADAELGLEAWIRALAKVARACGALHALGIVHRDVKPENVLMFAGEPRLADLGVAKDLDELDPERPGRTRTGVLVGTPYTMAPEQLGEGAVVPATDVHALGVMLIERLCGVAPFPPDSGELRLFTMILADERPKPQELARGVPRKLAAIAERAIARLPEERYPNGDALADALEAWLEPAWKDPRLLLVPAALILVGLLGVGVSLASGPRAKEEPLAVASTPEPRPSEPVRPAVEAPTPSAPAPADPRETTVEPPSSGPPPSAPPQPSPTEAASTPPAPAPEAPAPPVAPSPATPESLARALARDPDLADPDALLTPLAQAFVESLRPSETPIVDDPRPEWAAPLKELRDRCPGASPAERSARLLADALEVRYVADRQRLGSQLDPVFRALEALETPTDALVLASLHLFGLCVGSESPRPFLQRLAFRDHAEPWRASFADLELRAEAAPADEDLRRSLDLLREVAASRELLPGQRALERRPR
ncbi:MAG: serine/threonine-protein kinase [Planctomycetota bacterium]